MPHSPGIGAIFGIVSEDGVAKNASPVALYDRTTFQLVQKTLTASDGGYVFNGLNQNTSDYLVLATDEDGSPTKNALVQDRVQPVPAYSGATFGANWYLRARRLDPITLFRQRFLNGVSLPALGDYSNDSFTGSMLVDQSSITPGAPQMPSLRLNTGTAAIGMRAQHHQAPTGTAVYTPPYVATLECVVNTTESWQIWLPGRVGGGNGSPIAGMSWDATAKLLRTSCGKSIIGGGSTVPNLADASYYSTFTDDVSAVAAGVHHVVFAATWGDSLKTYIDGALFSTHSLSGLNSSLAANMVYQGLAICGIGSTLGTFTIGLVTFYPAALDATTVAALYNDVMVGTTPAATGFVKDLLIDEPAALVRLNAGSYGTENEYLTNSYPLTHYGTITVQQTSPVVGGAMTHFGGGVMRGDAVCAQVSQNAFGVEFFVNPDSATPAATGTLLAGRFSDDSQSMWKVQQLITTGKLSLTLRCYDNTNETINFNYAPPAATDTLVAIMIDKFAHTATVWENGVLKDTQTTSGTYLLVGTNASWQIGGLRSTSAVITEPFSGKLGEIALYGHTLTSDRLLSHYNARTLT